ncbi:MAG: pyruvate ferredoxin oxidoreductase [Candidatus Diapherotrites archaeon]|nr:pyruvate ferredoxin oxidoreductase [Candidatus Diapherotrites archaeon]
MVKKIAEGSHAVAEVVRLLNPDVLAMYPITPSTHIPERLSDFESDGELDGTIIRVDSEFSAMSALVGASATGVRTYTATSSQGLALMHEVLFVASAMRLPIVITVVNRALSAPLNIFNDWQDSISERDSGWIQMYGEDSQEVADLMVQAYRIAEDKRVLLPVMVCMDGFFLSHTYDVIDVPEDLKGFVPPYKPEHAYLDPKRPQTQGAWAMQEPYFELRKELEEAVGAALPVIKEVHDEFAKVFGRSYGGGAIDVYGEGDTVVVSMGSVCTNLKVLADRLGFQVVRVRCYRPFPAEDVKKALEGKKAVAVFEKDVAYGTGHGALYNDVRACTTGKAVNFIVGLGGLDVPINALEKMCGEIDAMNDGETRWQR